MKLELEEYRAEAAHLKNQQATIRRLEERNRQLEQQVCSDSTQLLALFS
jgi:homeobox protein cut-like